MSWRFEASHLQLMGTWENYEDWCFPREMKYLHWIVLVLSQILVVKLTRNTVRALSLGFSATGVATLCDRTTQILIPDVFSVTEWPGFMVMQSNSIVPCLWIDGWTPEKRHHMPKIWSFSFEAKGHLPNFDFVLASIDDMVWSLWHFTWTWSCEKGVVENKMQHTIQRAFLHIYHRFWLSNSMPLF